LTAKALEAYSDRLDEGLKLMGAERPPAGK